MYASRVRVKLIGEGIGDGAGANLGVTTILIAYKLFM